ncbi:hypothetical protein Q8A67_011308 [Cirrhinus molitorella]|uniref:Chemokine interleukin-8-like domain-containing protein n=1 Tax=Cirrhinus molitorella TaxID=172907 RepID=A0AA88PV14_9TELE|nr:hypothetical protein Q8A67_011308 [Cirrhinus molitorella]
MTLTVHALLAFTFSILLTVKAVESQYVPKTCECPQVKKTVRGPFSDVKVTPKGPNCLQDEIIVTLQKNNKLVCLSPESHLGKRLLNCWQRLQKDGKISNRCIPRQKQKPRQRNKKQAKSKKFITGSRAVAVSNREKCECVEETDSVQWRKITDYTIIEKHPLCNKVQIILQLTGKEVCLKADSKQGGKLQRCWKRIKFNTQKKKFITGNQAAAAPNQEKYYS